MGTLTVTDGTMTVTVMVIAIGTVTGTATATGTASASATVTGTVAVKTMDGRGTMMMMRTMTLVPREDTKSHCPWIFPPYLVGICFTAVSLFPLFSPLVRQDRKPQSQLFESCHQHLLMTAESVQSLRGIFSSASPSVRYLDLPSVVSPRSSRMLLYPLP